MSRVLLSRSAHLKAEVRSETHPEYNGKPIRLMIGAKLSHEDTFDYDGLVEISRAYIDCLTPELELASNPLRLTETYTDDSF